MKAYKRNKIFKQVWDETVKSITNANEFRPFGNRIDRIPTKNNRVECSLQEEITKLSYHEELSRKTLIAANEGRLDRLLYSEGLQRKNVPRYGDCFFEATCCSELISESPAQLRQSLCAHLQDNAVEYIGFFQSQYSQEKEEEFTEYLAELENLKKDGYWSNKAADLLPLALANYIDCRVTIYTSKPDQQKIVIVPTLTQNERNKEI